jgi:hypothetical protein
LILIYNKYIVKLIYIDKNIKDIKLVFSVAEKWNNVIIVTVEYHFLTLCIIILKKKCKEKKLKTNCRKIKIRT